jgi:predicted O-methyltransferase YrrM
MTPIKELIIDLYGEEYLKRSALRLRDGDEILREFLEGKGYRTIVEIGTYRGATAALLAQYCERVVTIDLKHGRMEQLGESHSRYDFWRSLGCENIELHLIDGDREKADILRRLHFDFAFIDGAHDASVASDFELVKKCGRVLFHEYDNTRPDQNYSYDFVNQNLPPNQVTVKDIFALWERPRKKSGK